MKTVELYARVRRAVFLEEILRVYLACPRLRSLRFMPSSAIAADASVALNAMLCHHGCQESLPATLTRL